MLSETSLMRFPGGQTIIDWFGGVPQFHDAELLQIELSSARNSKIVIHAWHMTDVVGGDGCYLTDRHALITIYLESVKLIDLSDFHETAIIFGLKLIERSSEIEISWTSSYGVCGRIVAGTLEFELTPGKP